ncbi:MAG: hypothetical protein CVU01_02570 [Bacteroidetes bacterium HGW-Bacteroidetes-18]|nr:MAG: hypothetical protein CVU01_02570 [Bacteroidetes bacterium HGW-Bacteroidetes-18]
MIEAEMFNHDLTLQFGLLSSECEDESHFIEKSILLIYEMKKYDKTGLDIIFFGSPPKMNNFYEVLEKILDNIAEVKKIPINNRTYE